MIPELRAIGQAEPETAADPGPESPPASTSPAPATENQVEDPFAPNPADSPDVAETKKSLVAAMHRRNNEVDAKLKDFEIFKRESEAFRALMANPEVADRITGKKAEDGAATTTGGMPTAKDVVARLPQYARDAVQPEFQEGVTSHVMGVLEALGATGIVQAVNLLLSERQQVQKQSAVQGLDQANVEKFMPEAEKLAARTGLSIRQALFAVSEGKVASAPQATRQTETPPARTALRSTPPSMAQRTGANGRVSDDEVARELLELDAAGGTPRYLGNMYTRRS